MYKDAIGDRMKDYENCYRIYLPKRQAVIVRLDGKAFHSFTKGFDRPYDVIFAKAMWETARKLCENVGGCVFGYTQSDEITLVLVDYNSIKTEPWFGNNLQKIVSVSASMATYFFNDAFRNAIRSEANSAACETSVHVRAAMEKMAVFDARAFIVPREEVVNCLYWRQLDCVRNSIQLMGQSNFSHNELQGKNCDEIQEMLFSQRGINWAKMTPQWFRNGVALYKAPKEVQYVKQDGSVGTVIREKWTIDLEIPMFSANPEYVNRYLSLT